MTEEEFRYKDTRMDAFKRQCDILKANYAVFMRRANDEGYGQKQDRDIALRDARECNKRFAAIVGYPIQYETGSRYYMANASNQE